MTKEERDELNAEYAIVCKGWCWKHGYYHHNTRGTVNREQPDNYLASDAELGRQVKVLLREHGQWIWTRRGNILDLGTSMTHSHYYGDDEHIAATRACVDLKVQVPND